MNLICRGNTRETYVAVFVGVDLAGAEIEEHRYRVVLIPEPDVVRLDVAMEEAASVEIVDGLESVDGDLRDASHVVLAIGALKIRN